MARQRRRPHALRAHVVSLHLSQRRRTAGHAKTALSRTSRGQARANPAKRVPPQERLAHPPARHADAGSMPTPQARPHAYRAHPAPLTTPQEPARANHATLASLQIEAGPPPAHFAGLAFICPSEVPAYASCATGGHFHWRRRATAACVPQAHTR